MANYCSECGKKLDKRTGLCPKCNRDQIYAQSRQTNSTNRSSTIKRIAFIALLFVVACAAYLFGNLSTTHSSLRSCHHEWLEATCTSPRTCQLCGAVEGEPTGHDWMPATCTMTQQCKVCKATLGTPLGHTFGAWTDSYDITEAISYRERTCTACGDVQKTNGSALETFVNGEQFIFTPREFMERFERYAKESYPDFYYKIDSIQASDIEASGLDFNSDVVDALLLDCMIVKLYLDESDSTPYYLLFYGANASQITKNDLDVGGVVYVALSQERIIDPESGYLLDVLDPGLTSAFYHACDPGISEDDVTTQNLLYLTAFLNWADFSEPHGEGNLHGLHYDFNYGIQKQNEQYVDIQVITAYPIA